MLKRIDPAEATLGMYVHKLEGRWMDHPFWRARFVLKDGEQLAKLRTSALDAVIIDTEKGCDLPLEEEGEPVAEAQAAPDPLPAGPAAAESETHPLLRRGMRRRGNLVAPVSAAREFGKASQLADRGVKMVSKVFFTMRLGKAVEPELVTPLIEDIFASLQRNPHAFNGLMACKRNAEFVYRHALATSALMITLARQIGLPVEMIHEAGVAGLLMDAGVNLLPVDFEAHGGLPGSIPPHIWRDHVRFGHDFVLGGAFGEAVSCAVLEHHERMDGTGYPSGLRGDEVSLLGRMAAICDSFDNLLNGFEADHAMGPAEALAHMAGDEGAFDPELLGAFTAAMGLYPVGSVVELRSGRLAMVTDQHPQDAVRPRLRVFYSARLRQAIMQEDLDLGAPDCDDAISGLADPAVLGGLDLAALRPRLLAASLA